MKASNEVGGSRKYVVVVGIDFSETSARALEEAARIVAARGDGAVLHLVHVLPVLPTGPSIMAAAVAPEVVLIEQTSRAARVLDQWMAPLRERCSRMASHLRTGSPDREIAQLASDLEADLVVVGSHGRRGFERLLLGSVAESLVRHAPCPVLVYRPREMPAWEKIEPPCPECLAIQRQADSTRLWCSRHAEHHPRAHTYYEVPESFGRGWQTFRDDS